MHEAIKKIRDCILYSSALCMESEQRGPMVVSELIMSLILFITSIVTTATATALAVVL